MNTHSGTVTPAADGTRHDHPLLDVNGAADYFGVSRRTIYRLIEGGYIHPRRVGNRLRFRIADLDAYVEGRPT